MLEAALAYARQGRRVHPCRPADKRPLTAWGSKATTIEADIRAMWKRWPDALVALCTGDGLVVVDVDPRHGGEYDEDLAATLTVVTRGGGWHHYYSTTEPVANAVGLIPGVDIRGDGGYVIAPPSPGWVFADDLNPVLPLPEVIVKLMANRARKAAAHGAGFEPAQAGSIVEGYRHDYMVSFAGFAIRALEIDDADELVACCLEEYARACSPADAPAANIRRIARSILAKHERSS